MDGLDAGVNAPGAQEETPVTAPLREKYERDADGRYIFPLAKPIVLGSTTIAELRFREPEAGDLRGIPLNALTTDHLMNVAGKVCGQPATVINKLSLADTFEIGAFMLDFLPDGLLTGFKG